MPKVSEEHRAARRQRILDAARTCIDRSGLQAVTMQGIIDESGLSTGSVYQYFRSKDDIVRAAIMASLEGLTKVLEPIIRDPVPGPSELVGELTAAITAFSTGDSFDGRRVALNGWSEALSNARLSSAMRPAYLAFRSQLREVVIAWQEAGIVPRSADPQDIAATLQSLLLGFAAQRALLGDVDPQMHARGIAALLG